ncbi:MAG: conjugal transfer protein TraX [Firmicutes bacterium]|nr:conjugal transfer protein TraX [Bacillota bacterium]
MSSFALHIWAMLLMLCDHLQLTLLPDLPILRCVGRLAFPLFAFMAVEGYLHTRSLKKYLLRLLMLAVISEVPFDLLVSGSVFDPMHQNVIWTIILGLCCIRAFENISADLKKMLSAVVIIASLAAAIIARVDYSSAGVLTLLAFYAFRGNTVRCRLMQLLSLAFINLVLLGGIGFAFPYQALAVLSLPIIWLYDGSQGPHNGFIKAANYLFYPAHMLILALFSA